MNQENVKELILHLLSRCNRGLMTTQLVKLVYLVDVAWTQMTGKPLTNAPYIWHHHGPYASEISEAVGDLVEDHKVNAREGTSSNNRPYRVYELLDRSAIDPPPKNVDLVVRYIVKNFAEKDLDSLLNYVYNTPPMVKAIRDGTKDQLLDLIALVPRTFHEADALDMIGQELDDDGRTVDIDEAMEHLGIPVNTT